MISLQKELSIDGKLVAHYKENEGKLKDLRISVTIEDRVENFVRENIWINNQSANEILDFKAWLLNKSVRVDSYEIIDDQLYLMMNSKNEVTLRCIRQDKPVQLELNISSDITIRELKKIIQKQLVLDKDFTLIDSEETELDDSTLLNQSKCILDHTVYIRKSVNPDAVLEEKNLGKYGLEMAFKKVLFSDLESIVHVPLSQEAEDWREIIPGLNMEGTCTNEKCEAKDQRVFDKKGFVTFELPDDLKNVCCPMCKEQLGKVTTSAFWDCDFSIIGTKEGQTKSTPITGSATKKEAKSFKDSTLENCLIEWKYLTITATPRKEEKITESISVKCIII